MRVFLACSGLGTIHRGYESFIRASYDALRRQPGLDVRLFKGSGAPAEGERALWQLPRDGALARAIGAVVRRGPYVVEQVTFAASLIPHVLREKPDVIFFCDPAIGKVLGRWRQMNAATYRLVFHNSGPIAPPFPWFDHVQQVTPIAHEAALAAGEPANRHTLLPCALDIGTPPVRATAPERAARRRALGFPETRPVILSVGALNRHHKRMDYLIREVASLPEPRPHLVMLGQQEADTPAVRAMANLLLGAHGFSMRTVGQHEVDEYYRAADVFTLASLREGFGLGYAEALAHGLPCIAHDFPVARFVLDDEGIYADLREPGALAEAISRVLASDSTEAVIQRRHAGVAQRFGWPELAPRYARMFRESTHQSQRRMVART
jgi:glycosyltransferase involved in cell wall biosynthesis